MSNTIKTDAELGDFHIALLALIDAREIDEAIRRCTIVGQSFALTVINPQVDAL